MSTSSWTLCQAHWKVLFLTYYETLMTVIGYCIIAYILWCEPMVYQYYRFGHHTNGEPERLCFSIYSISVDITKRIKYKLEFHFDIRGWIQLAFIFEFFDLSQNVILRPSENLTFLRQCSSILHVSTETSHLQCKISDQISKYRRRYLLGHNIPSFAIVL